MVLLSIGGNDVGFANLISYAILREKSPIRRLANVADSLYAPPQSLAKFKSLKARYHMLRRA
ncbi:MAG: hypothetical protein AAFR60_03615, partial [Pseudomonadota bacterium]